jgi:triacylglycerol esterase/lipase EstA (alpha/beta hydrolase family)
MERVLRAVRRAARKVERLAAALEAPGAENRVERRTEFEGCARPLLLLHGWFSYRRTFDVLERRLRRDGYGVFSLDLGGLRGSSIGRGIDDLADLVRAKVERIYARYPGLGPLTIVGHSKGGLIATYYVKRLGGWRRTRAVVTLGTPHRGTPLAWLGLPLAPITRSLVQMVPGSAFLARLQDGVWPAQVRLASIWSRRDAASPYPACLIETHGLSHLANVDVDADHRGLLTRKKVYEAIRRELQAAEAEAPVVRGPLTAMRGGRARAAAGGRAGSPGDAA